MAPLGMGVNGEIASLYDEIEIIEKFAFANASKIGDLKYSFIAFDTYFYMKWAIHHVNFFK